MVTGRISISPPTPRLNFALYLMRLSTCLCMRIKALSLDIAVYRSGKLLGNMEIAVSTHYVITPSYRDHILTKKCCSILRQNSFF